MLRRHPLISQLNNNLSVEISNLIGWKSHGLLVRFSVVTKFFLKCWVPFLDLCFACHPTVENVDLWFSFEERWLISFDCPDNKQYGISFIWTLYIAILLPMCFSCEIWNLQSLLGFPLFWPQMAPKTYQQTDFRFFVITIIGFSKTFLFANWCMIGSWCSHQEESTLTYWMNMIDW